MQHLSDSLARRIQQIRRETYGEDGIPRLAELMQLPIQTWEHYEAGVTIPATVLLGFIELSGADPHWLLTGMGARYEVRPGGHGRHAPAWSPHDEPEWPTERLGRAEPDPLFDLP
jgi:hypothetical protein